CLVAIIDADTNHLTMGNAGQCFPFLVRAGSAKELSLIGRPLGTKSAEPASSAEWSLQPGDVVVFFTDGLVEAMDIDGKQIGYERFQAALPGLIGIDASATRRAIHDWHHSMTRPGPADDDITLVVLQNQDSEITI
ncbi:MAG: serine/threonine-protein phosphatase, partial [Candidatus Riflebacteria bacterium]|nr:serine/threonine-protein phosphatase [Candidatus Riflebacteria bacterium]